MIEIFCHYYKIYISVILLKNNIIVMLLLTLVFMKNYYIDLFIIKKNPSFVSYV